MAGAATENPRVDGGSSEDPGGRAYRASFLTPPLPAPLDGLERLVRGPFAPEPA